VVLRLRAITAVALLPTAVDFPHEKGWTVFDPKMVYRGGPGTHP